MPQATCGWPPRSVVFTASTLPGDRWQTRRTASCPTWFPCSTCCPKRTGFGLSRRRPPSAMTRKRTAGRCMPPRTSTSPCTPSATARPASEKKGHYMPADTEASSPSRIPTRSNRNLPGTCVLRTSISTAKACCHTPTAPAPWTDSPSPSPPRPRAWPSRSLPVPIPNTPAPVSPTSWRA